MSVLIELTEEQVKSILQQIGRPSPVLLERSPRTLQSDERFAKVKAFFETKQQGTAVRSLEIQLATGYDSSALSSTLRALAKAGEIKMIHRGTWRKL